MGKVLKWIWEEMKAMPARLYNSGTVPLKAGWEVVNWWFNIPNQFFAWMRNTFETLRQTWNALKYNFLNFADVKGKRYQKLLKIPVNLISACTRRPLLIAWDWLTKILKKWVIMPSIRMVRDTVWHTLNWIWNSTLKFMSKDTEYQWQKYATDEAWDLFMTLNANFWFLWVDPLNNSSGWLKENSPKEDQPKEEKWKGRRARRKEKREKKRAEKNAKKEEKKMEQPKIEKKSEQPKVDKKVEEPKKEKKSETIMKKKETKKIEPKTDDKPKSIKEIEDNHKKVNKEKDIKDKKPRKNLNEFEKKRYQKDFEALLWNNLTEQWVIDRWEKNKKWSTIEEIMENLEKDYYTFSTYIQDEIVGKQQLAKSA